jgi:hypothetical protein
MIAASPRTMTAWLRATIARQRRRTSSRGASDSRTTGRGFAICASAYVVVAAAVAVVQATAPFTRGWWLVAYLILVGGLSQLLLGSGLIALARRSAASAYGAIATRAQLALWNAGTVTVAVADLVEAPPAVLAGSVALYGALTLFGLELRRVIVTARRPSRRCFRAYVLLLLFLAGSVVIGAALAGALPGG